MARAGGEPETGAVDPGGGVALLKSFESSSGRACWLPDCLVGVGLSSNFRRADRLRLLMFDVSTINHSILAGTRRITGGPVADSDPRGLAYDLHIKEAVANRGPVRFQQEMKGME